MPKAALIPAKYVPGIDVKKVEIALTASQINNLFSAPIEAIPAPGVGKCVVVRAAWCKHEFGTTQFGTNPGIFYGQYAVAQVMDYTIIGSIPATSDMQDSRRFSINANPFVNWPIRENQSVIVSAEGSLFPEGDGTATVGIEYTIEDY